MRQCCNNGVKFISPRNDGISFEVKLKIMTERPIIASKLNGSLKPPDFQRRDSFLAGSLHCYKVGAFVLAFLLWKSLDLPVSRGKVDHIFQ